MSFDQEIIDFAAAVMLRHFHTGTTIPLAPERLVGARDRDILLGYWALSPPVQDFVVHLRRHPHELETALSPKLSVSDAVIRGRVDARLTWMHRARTGNGAAIVSHEPERVADLELNRLVAWLLRAASDRLIEMLSWQSAASPYLRTVEDRARNLTTVTRVGGAAEVLRHVHRIGRPSAAAIRRAGRSRRSIYRLALASYQLFSDIEAGHKEAIATVLNDAVVGPLEGWKRWELAVGLALGEALARATSESLTLRILAGDSTAPIVRVAGFDIYWQHRTSYASNYSPEPTELRTLAALRDYGLGSSADRPDLVVVDRTRHVVVAIVEVKYSAGESAQDRFREAVRQVVRYSRAYGDVNAQRSLVGRSLVLLSSGAPRRREFTTPAPAALEWADLKDAQALDRWARSLVQLREGFSTS